MTVSTVRSDVISDLAGVQPGSPLAELRAQRPEASNHAQGSYNALFSPSADSALSQIERLAMALRVAVVHSATEAADHYRQRLQAISPGSPSGWARAGGEESEPLDGSSVSGRLKVILQHADLLATRPRQARPDHLQALADAGLSTAEIVTLSQVIAFVSFQVRVIAGLRLLSGQTSAAPASNGAQPEPVPSASDPPTSQPRTSQPTSPSGTSRPTTAPPPAAKIVRPDDTLKRPAAFTVDQLAWTPWLEPVDLADATPKQAAALEGSRANSPYFRLLALDVDVLTERTATDRGIFYTPGGAPRAERELAAAATSRLNGCIYCASVHARLAAQLSKRHEDVDRLLREGVTPGTELHLDPRWQGVVDLAVALAAAPPSATLDQVTRLREIGFGDLELLDVMQAGAFFAWANRLMLTLGEPYYAEE
jgi:alkylhydroperoxidase domain protein/CMD domain protein